MFIRAAKIIDQQEKLVLPYFHSKIGLKKFQQYIFVVLLAGAALFYFVQKNPGSTGPVTGNEPFDRTTASYIFTRHARCRMDCRHIDEAEIREIVQKGTINYAKSDPNGRPDPKYALEGRTRDGQDVRLIIAPSSKGLVVITVIDLDREWACDCK